MLFMCVCRDALYVRMSWCSLCAYVVMLFMCVCRDALYVRMSHVCNCYWRMQNNCTTSDRFKRFVFQRCRLLLVVNVQKKYSQCKYATLYGYETVARWSIILHTPVCVYLSVYDMIQRHESKLRQYWHFQNNSGSVSCFSTVSQ
jgi:hypothetical protein